MNAKQLGNVLDRFGELPVKLQVGKRVFEVKGVMSVAPGSTDAILSIEKLKTTRTKKEKETVKLQATVEVVVEKVTKKEREKLIAKGCADNDQALTLAKAKAFIEKAKMRGCTITVGKVTAG